VETRRKRKLTAKLRKKSLQLCGPVPARSDAYSSVHSILCISLGCMNIQSYYGNLSVENFSVTYPIAPSGYCPSLSTGAAPTQWPTSTMMPSGPTNLSS
jgi:hypothetical protein